jgi:hypothetical protein
MSPSPWNIPNSSQVQFTLGINISLTTFTNCQHTQNTRETIVTVEIIDLKMLRNSYNLNPPE